MAEEKGIPQYRCQRCGELTMNSKAPPDVPYQVLRTFLENPLAIAVGVVPKTGIHICDDQGVGLAHIVGIFPAELVPLLRHKEEEAVVSESKSGKEFSN